MAIAIGLTHARSDFPRFFVANSKIAGKLFAEFCRPAECNAAIIRAL